MEIKHESQTTFHVKEWYDYARSVGFVAKEHLFVNIDNLKCTWCDMEDGVTVKSETMGVCLPWSTSPIQVTVSSIFDKEKDTITVFSHVRGMGKLNALVTFEQDGQFYRRTVSVRLEAEETFLPNIVQDAAVRYALTHTLPRVLRARDRSLTEYLAKQGCSLNECTKK